jgi:hypothetical protein
MTSTIDPEACGRPCDSVLQRLLFELTRARARAELRMVRPCEECGASNPIVLGRGTRPSRCYRHRVRETERHHPRTRRVGPEIPTDANEHRVLSEAERIWQQAARPGLCLECALGCNRFLVIRLAALGSLG